MWGQRWRESGAQTQRPRDLRESVWKKWPAERPYALQSWLIPLFTKRCVCMSGALVWAVFRTTNSWNFCQRMGLRCSPEVSQCSHLLAGSFALAKSLASALGEEIGFGAASWFGLLRMSDYPGTALTARGGVDTCGIIRSLSWGDGFTPAGRQPGMV